MARIKLVNNIESPFTAEEEAARDAWEAQEKIKQQAFDDAQTKKSNDSASGKTKLKDLGLTDDEIKALIGK